MEDRGLRIENRKAAVCRYVLDRRFSILYRRSSILDPRFSILELHSYRSATIGSTLVARRAGTKQAARATPVSNSAIRPNVIGSVALTPNSRCAIKRVKP